MAAPVLHRVPLCVSEQRRAARPAAAGRPGTAAVRAARHPGQGGTAKFTPQGQSTQPAMGVPQQATAPPWQQQLWNGQPPQGGQQPPQTAEQGQQQAPPQPPWAQQ